ncbi:MAG: hypothetical protein ABIR98_00075 [Usitatibacter sp.]
MNPRRFARAGDLDLTPGEYRTLARLSSPEKIQAFLNAIPCNHEIGGETVLSVREVLKQRRAHCIEGAMVAAAALWVNGYPPLLMHLDCHRSDYPHVIAVFRRGGYWGALSKTNGAPLRYRDPIYRSLRELTLSYFHEYSNKRGHKTLRSYSVPYDMRRIDPAKWVTAAKSCWETHDLLTDLRHYPLISARQERLLARLDRFVQISTKAVEYPRPPRPK